MNRHISRTARITALVFLVIVSACAEKPASPYTGALYFGQGAYVMRLALRDGSLSVAGHLGDTVVRDVSGYGDEYLLVAGTATIHQQRISRIGWFELRTGARGDMYGGLYARYLAAADTLLYDDGTALFAVPQRDRSDNTLVYAHPRGKPVALIEASPGTALLETREFSQPVIHAWDGASGELRRLDELAARCRLEGAVWVERVRQLLCKPRGGDPQPGHFLVTNLEGEVDRTLALPAGISFRALASLPDQHAVVLQGTSKSWIGDDVENSVWLLSTANWQATHFADDIHLGRGVAFSAQ